MDLQGHRIHMGAQLPERAAAYFKVRNERGAQDLGDWSSSEQCQNCEVSLSFRMGEGEAVPRLEGQYDREARDYVPTKPCTYPQVKPVVTRFVCRSGRVAVGNDFRGVLPAAGEFSDKNTLGSVKAIADYVKGFAALNYVTGMAGNVSVYFMPAEDGIDVVYDRSECGEFETDAEYEACAAQFEGIPQVSLALWWYAIVDAADLPKGATDSYDREIQYLDLEPGTYEVTYHHELREQKQAVREVWGTLRKIDG